MYYYYYDDDDGDDDDDDGVIYCKTKFKTLNNNTSADCFYFSISGNLPDSLGST